jgi:hypothetical protein
MSRMWEPRESANDRIDGGPVLRSGDLIQNSAAAPTRPSLYTDGIRQVASAEN